VLSSSVLGGDAEAVGGARALGRAAVIAPGTDGEARALGDPVEAADTDVATAGKETCGKARAQDDTVKTSDTDPSRRLRFSHHWRRAAASSLSTTFMISKSRLTASSSKPVPRPTINALVEIAEEAETIDNALELGSAVANTPGTDGEDAQEGSAEEADTDVAAAKEEACGEARARGDPVETADTDAATAEEETFGEARTQGEAALVDPET
jgi:hypothetical protein